jgi:hypothetical protein
MGPSSGAASLCSAARAALGLRVPPIITAGALASAATRSRSGVRGSLMGPSGSWQPGGRGAASQKSAASCVNDGRLARLPAGLCVCSPSEASS